MPRGRKIQEVCFHESIFFNGLRRPLAILRFWPENFAAPFLAFAAKTCFLQIPVIKAPLTPVAGFSREMGSIRRQAPRPQIFDARSPISDPWPGKPLRCPSPPTRRSFAVLGTNREPQTRPLVKKMSTFQKTRRAGISEEQHDALTSHSGGGVGRSGSA